jgi:hypothetical protein
MAGVVGGWLAGYPLSINSSINSSISISISSTLPLVVLARLLLAILGTRKTNLSSDCWLLWLIRKLITLCLEDVVACFVG